MSKSQITTYQRTSNYYHRPRIISINTFKILFYLTKKEGSAYFSEIKTYLNRSSSQVSQIMRRLKIKNYVKVENCRPLKYSITELGRKVNRQTING
ncbi:MAG: transcriptional regulator, partial [Promethearchaeota archaeon]